MGRTSTLVVGGGCSGVLAAVALLRDGTDQVTVLEPGGVLGAGIAYSTPVAVHMLNSRAGTMSGDPGNPDDFVDWTRRRHDPVGPAGFAARREYGRYLHDLIDAAAIDHPGRFSHVRARATALRVDGHVEVTTDRTGPLRADRVVLAIGHGAPETPRRLGGALAHHPRYVADPWRPDALEAVPLDAPVLLLGTGLTAVDVALVLAARGMRAPIRAVSRHGLLPLAHTEDVHPVRPPSLTPVGDLGALTRQLRRAAAGAEDWRDVVDGVRSMVNSLWNGLSLEDRRRFLRHLGRYWEVHRHRMAPSVAVLVHGLLTDGALRVQGGGVADVSHDGTGFVVTAAPGVRSHLAAIINCTGPGSAARTALGGRLLADGLARRDPLGLGIDVDGDGRLVSSEGRAQERIVVVGPARRGQWWETVAVPEISVQAWALSRPDARSRGAPDPVSVDVDVLGRRFAA
ncbi:MAG TPA: FAD/NAD(P)-binding protein [Rugosimonospora sp.]